MDTTTVISITDGKHAIAHLNDLLRGELSAVEAFSHFIREMKGTDSPVLDDCLESHERRVQKLRDRVQELGGTPVATAGIWEAFLRLVRDGTERFSRTSALSSLVEGEADGLARYRATCEELDLPFKDLIEGDLLVEQVRTHAAVNALCHPVL